MSSDTPKQFENFLNCCEDAPTGTYEAAKTLRSVLGDTADRLMRDIHKLGLAADNCDLIFAVEVALYNYVKLSNPDSTIFPTAEGFGRSMNDPARERVIAQAERDRDFLASLGAL